MVLNIDLRSLAAFRVCFGLYLLWDIYSRLSLGSQDLAWYTSGELTSILDENDTPHRSPLHRIWFFRGSKSVQAMLFAVTAVLAALYTIGHPYCPKPLLWFLVVAYQNRNMHVHDGSDNFCRQLLLWSCFLPIDAVWSWKGMLRPSRKSVVVLNMAMYGFCTQIVLMYFGTICHRTIDLYDWKNLHRSEWLPPKLTAVHYALSGSFAVRDNPVNHFIQSHLFVSQSMTMVAMIVEFLAPFGCVLGGDFLRSLCAVLLVMLHFGLLVSLRLPHWQLLTILTHATVWIPNATWNRWFPESSKEVKNQVTQYRVHTPVASKILQAFLFSYMIINFAGERKWVPKLDNGDIGEALRISQYWVMFATVGHTAQYATLTFDDGKPTAIARYPARWERALHQWASSNDKARVRKFLVALCELRSPRPREIQWMVSHQRISPPPKIQGVESDEHRATLPSSVTVFCEASRGDEHGSSR